MASDYSSYNSRNPSHNNVESQYKANQDRSLAAAQKGWTGPKTVDGLKSEGFWRSHQVPFSDMSKPEHLQLLEDWLRSYRPQDLFDESGMLLPEIAALAPAGDKRMSANRHANGGALRRPLRMPDFTAHAVPVAHPGESRAEATRVMGAFLREVMKANLDSCNFPRLRPRRDRLEPAAGAFRGHRPSLERRDGSRRRASGP